MVVKQEAALLNAPGVKVVRIPVVIGPALMSTPREKIDVQVDFIDFKIANLDDVQLTDALGIVKKAGKDLEKWEKLAVDVMKGRMKAAATTAVPEEGVELVAGAPLVVIGEKYQAILTSAPRRALNKEKLEAKFGVDALEDCYVETPVDTLNVKPLG